MGEPSVLWVVKYGSGDNLLIKHYDHGKLSGLMWIVIFMNFN